MKIVEIRNDRIAAMKARNRIVSTILGLVISDCQRKQDESDTAVVKSIKSIIDSNRETLGVVEAGSLKAQALNVEIQTLQKYMPQPLTGDTLRAMVEHKLKQIESPTMRDMGQVMGYVNKHASDNNLIVDGNEVKGYVQAFIK